MCFQSNYAAVTILNEINLFSKKNRIKVKKLYYVYFISLSECVVVIM